MKKITARYTTLVEFYIPKNVYLLPLDEAEDFQNEGKAGYWWIKWGTLYYIDKNRNTCVIEPTSRTTDTKWTDDIEEEEVSSDEE
jgi:hypothetical protein